MLLPNKSAGRAELGLEGLESEVEGEGVKGEGTPPSHDGYLPYLTCHPSMDATLLDLSCLPGRPLTASFFSRTCFFQVLGIESTGIISEQLRPVEQ